MKTIEDFYADEAIRKAAGLSVHGKSSLNQSHNVSRDDDYNNQSDPRKSMRDGSKNAFFILAKNQRSNSHLAPISNLRPIANPNRYIEN